ncbi:MAG: NfeD family protein [Lachnospiraceae bacterium]|nr:NfeD family protein [Lachnospiraceae bacterium]
MNEMLIFWLVLLILCIVIEVLTLGLTTIWFAGGALVAIFASLLYAPIFVQIILFFVVSLAMLFFTRPIAMKYFNKDRVKTNVEGMVGRQAIVTGEIDNVKATGQVTVNGQEWTARSCDDRVKIPEGAIVTVRAINGVKLIVDPGEDAARHAADGQKPAERTDAGANRTKQQGPETRNPETSDSDIREGQERNANREAQEQDKGVELQAETVREVEAQEGNAGRETEAHQQMTDQGGSTEKEQT